jgi:hypothetical protein
MRVVSKLVGAALLVAGALFFAPSPSDAACPAGNTGPCSPITAGAGISVSGVTVTNKSAAVTGAVKSDGAGNYTQAACADLSNAASGCSAAAGITALTGDVTASGSGSQAATIANNAVTTAKINNSAVTLPKIANAAANSKLVGSGATGSGSPYTEITLGTNLSMSGTTLNAAGVGSGCSTSGSSVLQGDGAGGCSNVTVNSPLTFSGGNLGIQSAGNAQLGAAQCDGVTLTCSSGVMSINGSVVAGTSQTISATQWNQATIFVVTTSAQTLTLPLSTAVSANSAIIIQTIGQTVTLTANAADAINGGSTGGSVTIQAGHQSVVTTDGAGNMRVSSIA